jgi:hypothetical protein
LLSGDTWRAPFCVTGSPAPSCVGGLEPGVSLDAAVMR